MKHSIDIYTCTTEKFPDLFHRNKKININQAYFYKNCYSYFKFTKQFEL